MNRRLESAIKAVEGIKSKLAEYGLAIDYARYFEEKLQIPLTAVRTMSELETDGQRELLQNLFVRHISGQYDTDGDYVSYIHIIEELDAEDIKILNELQRGEELKPEIGKSSSLRKLYKNGLIDIYHEVEALKGDGEMPLGVEVREGKTAQTWGAMVGKEKVMQAGKPYLTEYGVGFLEACTGKLSV